MTRILSTFVGLCIMFFLLGFVAGANAKTKGDAEFHYYQGYVDGKASCFQPSL